LGFLLCILATEKFALHGFSEELSIPFIGIFALHPKWNRIG
jgi:hypothetical protein